MIALMKNIEAPKIIRPFWEQSAGEFEGELKNNEFEIKRIIRYRNSFLPLIKGRVENSGDGTRLIIEMRINVSAALFMTIWCGFLALGISWTIIFQDDYEPDSIGIPIAMLVFGYVLVMSGYLYEARKAKDLLLSITQGRIT